MDMLGRKSPFREAAEEEKARRRAAEESEQHRRLEEVDGQEKRRLNEEEETRRREAEEDKAEEAERVRCREKGQLAQAEASPLARAWLEDDERAPAEAATSALESLGEGLYCNPREAVLWPLFGLLLHMHRQLPLSSLLALRHAVELQPNSALACEWLRVEPSMPRMSTDEALASHRLRAERRGFRSIAHRRFY